MEILNKSIWELLKEHISIYEEMEWKWMCWASWARQLDFLEFWVDSESMQKYSPWIWINGEITPPRDNPNYEITEYENVYRLVWLESIEYSYFMEGRSPVKILQWYQVKNQHRQGWKITIYGKWLRLYFNGLINWLPDYVKKYQQETIRADLCRDRQGDKIPAGVIDLKCQKTVPDDSNWTWKYFWNGDLTARIYDKSLDLKDGKWAHYWLYPDWYQENTWRVEFVFKGKYAKSLSPIEWLWQCPTDWVIKEFDKKNYDRSIKNFRSMLRAMIYCVDDSILTTWDKIGLYWYVRELIELKLSKLWKKKDNIL